VPDFSAHENYGLSGYPGAEEALCVYDYLQAAFLPEDAASSDAHNLENGMSTNFVFQREQALELLKAYIPDVNAEGAFSLEFERTTDTEENTYESYILAYTRSDGKYVTVRYQSNGNFIKYVNLKPVGSKKPQILIFDSREETVNLFKPETSPA